MGLVGNIVVFCCTWWLFFFMNASRDFENESHHEIGFAKSAPKNFSFKNKFWKITKITAIFCLIINLVVFFDCLTWIISP